MTAYYCTSQTMFHRNAPDALSPLKYDFAEGDHRLFPSGKPLEHWHHENKALFDNDTDGELCDFLIGMMFIYFASETLKNWLAEQVGDQIQFLPIVLQNRDTGEAVQKAYYVLNVLNVIDCFDPEATEIMGTYVPGNPVGLKYGAVPVMKADKIPSDLKIFVLPNPLTYVFRDDLVRQIKKSDFTGFVFKKLKTS